MVLNCLLLWFVKKKAKKLQLRMYSSAVLVENVNNQGSYGFWKTWKMHGR